MARFSLLALAALAVCSPLQCAVAEDAGPNDAVAEDTNGQSMGAAVSEEVALDRGLKWDPNDDSWSDWDDDGSAARRCKEGQTSYCTPETGPCTGEDITLSAYTSYSCCKTSSATHASYSVDSYDDTEYTASIRSSISSSTYKSASWCDVSSGTSCLGSACDPSGSWDAGSRNDCKMSETYLSSTPMSMCLVLKCMNEWDDCKLYDVNFSAVRKTSTPSTPSTPTYSTPSTSKKSKKKCEKKCGKKCYKKSRYSYSKKYYKCTRKCTKKKCEM